MASERSPTQQLLRQRLLRDINELKRKPYPGIELHIDDRDLSTACLVLAPEGETPLHLTLHFGKHFPLSPADIRIQSKVSHPNVFGDRLCINMLTDPVGYTPAYTVQGICIQLLSFFYSDVIPQMYGEHGGLVDRKKWQETGTDGMGLRAGKDTYCCRKCDFPASLHARSALGSEQTLGQCDPTSRIGLDTVLNEAPTAIRNTASTTSKDLNHVPRQIVDLPGELLLVIFDNLDEESLLLAARAWDGFGRVMREYNIIRTRELQCFTLKQGFHALELGIGVHFERTRGADRQLSSEFDLLSWTAFKDLQVQRSIQGLFFEHWLPLPIAHKHWQRAKPNIDNHLRDIQRAANIAGSANNVIYSFMNDVVVRLSKEAEGWQVCSWGYSLGADGIKSSLTAVSEKAIESYFHLFHLLLCLACERPSIPNEANKIMQDFINGNRDKTKVPNLGWMLIMILISEVDVTPDLTKSIIEEAITRNVVWMLDRRGHNMAELSFMESNKVSEYRLQKTFEAGKTSYRILMFLNIMRKVVRSTCTQTLGGEGSSVKKLTIPELRDKLFSRHGAPPNGAAAKLAQQIKDIQKVDCFPDFLRNMDVPVPNPSSFTAFLRSTVLKSHQKGYTKAALTQEQALGLRLSREGEGVECPEGMSAMEIRKGYSFFPNKRGGNGGRDGRGGRGGRGGRRGRGGGWRGGR